MLCFADPPEITGEQSYIQEGSEGIKLELVCIVHASPKANVTWYKDGRRLQHQDRIVIEKIGRKHLLAIRNLDENRDAGTYTCHATNPVGEYKENFHVQGMSLIIMYFTYVIPLKNITLELRY